MIYIIVEKISAIKKNAQHAKQLIELKHTFDQTLLQSQLEIQEQTFRSISQEIHDNIGQVLTLAKLNLNIMGPLCSHLPMMGATHELVTKAINDLRDLSKGLSPERVAEIELTESIAHELQMLDKTSLYTTSFQTLGNPLTLDKEKKIILFRIFQELINNIVKHAEATTIDVLLDYAADALKLLVTDNGKGFIVDGQYKGIGMRNIQNRSSLIGAELNIISHPNDGTSASVCLPV